MTEQPSSPALRVELETGDVLAQGTVWFTKDTGFALIHLPVMDGLKVKFQADKPPEDQAELDAWLKEGPVIQEMPELLDHTLKVKIRRLVSAPAAHFSRQIFRVRSLTAHTQGVSRRKEVLTIDMRWSVFTPLPHVVVEVGYAVSYQTKELEADEE